MSTPEIVLPKTKKRLLTVTISGLTPLVSNRMLDDSRESMEAKKTGTAIGTTRKNRDAKADAEGSMHKVEINGELIPSHPSSAIFQAVVEGWARGVPYQKKSLLTGFRMASEMMPLDVIKERNRHDALKNNGGGTDTRFRREYTEWGAVFEVILYEETLSLQHFLQALQFAGERVGIGPHYMRKYGMAFGRFEVVSVS